MSVILRKKKLKDGRQSLYLDIYNNGKRHYEFLKLYTKRGDKNNKQILLIAETKRAMRDLDLKAKNHRQVSPNKKKTSFIRYFENFIKDKSKTSNFYSSYKYLLKYTAGKDIQFKYIDTEWLENYASYLKKTKLKPNSIFVYFRILKTVLYKASEDGYILKDVITDMKKESKPEKEKTHIGYLEDFEIQKLIDVGYKSSEIRKAFLFGCFTGLRQSDVKNLKWSNIKDGYYDIIVQKTRKKGKADVRFRNKLNKNALSIINDNLIHLPDTYVFNFIDNRTSINRHLTRWFKSAGIEKRAFYHLSRHTFGTLSITAGNDLYVTAKLMGHADIKMTQIYADVVKDKKEAAVDNFKEFVL